MARKVEHPPALAPGDARKVRKLNREIKTWRKLRWFLTLTSVLGMGVSGVLLVVHAPDNLWAQVVGAWPPVAVFIIIEILARVPINSPWMGVGRIVVSLSVAGAGLYLSYGQQIDLMEDLGYGPKQAIAFPWTIDGFMIVSTLSVVEVARRIRTLMERIDLIEDPEPVAVVVAPAVVAAVPTVANVVSEPVAPAVTEEPAVKVSEKVEPVNEDKPAKPHRRRSAPRQSPNVPTGVKPRTERPAITATVVDAVFVEPERVMVD